MSTYYHGTGQDIDVDGVNPESGYYDFCATDDEAIAWDYARCNDDARVCIIECAPACIADEQDAWDIVKGIFGEDAHAKWPLYYYLDETKTAEALLAAGFDGVEFEDESPDASIPHATIRFYRPGLLKIVEVITED